MGLAGSNPLGDFCGLGVGWSALGEAAAGLLRQKALLTPDRLRFSIRGVSGVTSASKERSKAPFGDSNGDVLPCALLPAMVGQKTLASRIAWDLKLTGFRCPPRLQTFDFCDTIF